MEAALPPIITAIDEPPAEALSANVGAVASRLTPRAFDPAAAHRLRDVADWLLAGSRPS
ncbi:hypothetical protein [Streptomyces sp. NPDC050422]|uniref:hypothetical protein n=1 Tax=Streptomyces sp. NPDC050422 TaxID=3365614 RepID=UPI0037AF61DF